MDNTNNNQGSQEQNSNQYAGQNPNQFQTQNSNPYQGQNPNQSQTQNSNLYQGQNPSQFQTQNSNPYQGQNPNQFQTQNSNPYQGQNQNQFQGQNYGQNQYQGNMNKESGNTYWESGMNGQNQAQGTPAQNTPAQFYQNYGQQMNRDTNYGQPMPPQPSKKKSHKKLTAVLIVVVILAALGVTAFAFQDKIKNVLSLQTKSPKSYYAFVEKKEIERLTDKLKTQKNNFDMEKGVACNLKADLSYDKATVNSLIQGQLGMTIEDLESQIGIPLDNIGFDTTFAVKDSNVYDNLVLNLNKTNIISMELFLNSLKNEVLVRFPELSDAYLRQSLKLDENNVEFDFGKTLSQLKTISPEKNAEFIKRYANLIVDQIEDVELSKNEELEVNKETVKCNKLIVTLKAEDFKNIISEVLKEAKNDEYILDLLPLFNVTKEQYLSAIKEAESELKDAVSSSGDDKIVMNVYVNSDGEILGRDIKVSSFANKDSSKNKSSWYFASSTKKKSTAVENTGSVGFYHIKKGEQEEFQFFVNDETDTSIINISGSQTNKSGSYTGNATVDINSGDLGPASNMSFEVKYEDARRVIKDNMVFNYGKYTLSSAALMGAGLEANFDVKDNKQNVKLIVNMGTTPLVTLNMTAEYLKDYDIPAVSNSAQVFDTTDSESYASTINYEKFVSDLSAKLGVDVQSIIDNFSSNY